MLPELSKLRVSFDELKNLSRRPIPCCEKLGITEAAADTCSWSGWASTGGGGGILLEDVGGGGFGRAALGLGFAAAFLLLSVPSVLTSLRSLRDRGPALALGPLIGEGLVGEGFCDEQRVGRGAKRRAGGCKL